MEELRSLKEKLPKGWSYALKPSHLDEAIVSANIALPVTLYQSYKAWASNAPAFSANYYPVGSYSGGEIGSISVLSYAVPSEERKSHQLFAEEQFIPKLIDWVASIEAIPEHSTINGKQQRFEAEGAPKALSKREHPPIPKGQRRPKR